MKIHLLGDPTHISESLVARLNQHGVTTVANGRPVEGALVVVATSCEQGPSRAGQEALLRWKGTNVHVLGVLLTDVDSVLDPDLMELVFLETRDLVFADPSEGGMDPDPSQDSIADALPVLHDNAPNLAEQVEALAHSLPPLVRMNPLAPRKPRWKFW